MEIKTVIAGAAGRMGRELVTAVLRNDNFSLAAAIEQDKSPHIGQDAGLTAGCENIGIPISSDLDSGLTGAHATIDFSSSEAAVENTRKAVAAGCVAVVGVTGFDQEQREEFDKLASEGGRIVIAPNMSVGVNLLFHLCREVASVLGQDYDAEIVEMHHNQKKDAPSGTAVRLGEITAEATGRDYSADTKHGRQGIIGPRSRREIGMHALRGGDVVGEHTLIFAGEGERVELTHKASSRQTFCRGALRAIEFLRGAEPGVYDMQDVLGLR